MSDYLYYTALPVLLGGRREAGRRAKVIWRRYGLTPHWFGVGRHFLLTSHAHRHLIPKKIGQMSDTLLLQILLDHAKEQASDALLALLPCEENARAFLERQKDALEPFYAILPHDAPWDAPLSPLIEINSQKE